MFNNDITYDERWGTSENKKYLSKLQNKYMHRSICAASCPVGWAKEVYELLEYFDKEFGVAYNTSTYDGFYIKDSILKGLFVKPIVGAISNAYRSFIQPLISKDEISAFYRDLPLKAKLHSVASSFYYPIEYSLRVLKSKTIYRLLNYIKKPKITLDQVKEKYGELNIYFTAPDWLKEHLDLKIRETELKLAMKGCYYPVESFYYASTSWYCGTQFHPTEYATKIVTHNDGSSHINVEMYTYREAMANLGLNLNDIKALADARVSNNLKR